MLSLLSVIILDSTSLNKAEGPSHQITAATKWTSEDAQLSTLNMCECMCVCEGCGVYTVCVCVCVCVCDSRI